MKKLISAASAFAMAATMVSAAVPFAAGAADASKGLELRAFTNKAGEAVSTKISEDAIKAGDVTIPVGVYLVEDTNELSTLAAHFTIDSKDGDASNTNVTFTKGYVPGDSYFDSKKSYTLADGSSGELDSLIGFSGTIASVRGKAQFNQPSTPTCTLDTQQAKVGAKNAWGSVIWNEPADGSGYTWSGKTSDEYPLFVFDVTFKKGTPNGTYTIDFIDYATQPDVNPEISATMLEVSKTKYTLGKKNLNLKSIDIVIGEAASGSTTTTAGSTTTTAGSTTTTKAGSTTTTGGGTTTTKAAGDDDVVVTLTAQQKIDDDHDILADFIVKGGTYGNAKLDDGAHWECETDEDDVVKPGDTISVDFFVEPGDHLGAMFIAELADLPAGFTASMSDNNVYAVQDYTEGYKILDGSYQAKVMNKETSDPSAIEAGESVISIDITVADSVKAGTYEVGLRKFRVVEHAQVPVIEFDATLIPATIMVGGPKTTTTAGESSTTTSSATTTTKKAESSTTTTTKGAESSTTTTKKAESSTTTASTTKVAGDVLYGDTNCDGKVNIADVVVLNKWLNDAKSYNIEDQGKINADCCDAKGGEGLDKNDSDAIIRSIVHLVELPCASADLK